MWRKVGGTATVGSVANAPDVLVTDVNHGYSARTSNDFHLSSDTNRSNSSFVKQGMLSHK